MRCFAPRTRAPVQAKAASRADRRAREGRPGGGLPAGLSLANVPVHAPAGLPGPLKARIERRSGLAMDDVRVHRDSAEPAKLGALAYTQDRDIHLGPGQERHLPHEAWHAVQQKQRRVKATARLGDVALNEDPALEADADRMGASAARPGPPPAQLRRAPVRDGPVQRKVRDGIKPLDAAQPMSGVLSQYVASKVTYFLGEKSRADLTQLPVHLLDSRFKYLLGENHSSDRWEKATTQWPIIPKMMEHEKRIPHEKDDTTGRLDILSRPAQLRSAPLPLENLHAYLLTILLDAYEYTNLLNGQFAGTLDRQNVALITSYANRLKGKLGEIGEIRVAYRRWADKYDVVDQEGFAAKYDPKRHGASPRLTQIKRFADDLSRAWSVSLGGMRIAARKLGESMAEIKVENLPDDKLEAARSRVETIAEGKGAISALSSALTGIVGFSRLEDEMAVRTFAASSLEDAPQEVDDALNLERERGMIANIRAAEAPLLVRIGNFHLAGVAKGAGKNVLALDQTVPLTRFTERSTFFEPVVEERQAKLPRR